MEEPQARFAADASLLNQVDAIVRRIVAEFCREATEVNSGDHFADLGLNSVRFVELAFVLEELFRMGYVDMAEAPRAETVEDLSRFLAGKVAAGAAALPSAEETESAARRCATA